MFSASPISLTEAYTPSSSIREWAMRQGWGGRPVCQEQAQRIRTAALGMLARRFRYEQAA
jgi:hypothetical protein